MDPNAHRSRGGRSPGADAYWARRFFTLVAGLGLVGLLAWACSGVASSGNSSHSSGSGGPSSAAYASTASDTPSPSQAVTSAPASPSPTASASPSASPPASASATRSAAASSRAQPARAAAGPTACPPAGLVLTLVASRASYGPKDTPAFQVDIVSTNPATCTLDTGAAALKLVVRHGSTVAYNSASCLHGAQRHVISLRRGVPVVTSMTWNRHQTASGCSTTVLAAANRTYSAVVQAGGAQSPAVSFRLTGAPAATATSKAAAQQHAGA
jgi:hypothetical protein